jgi:hypothetical protein
MQKLEAATERTAKTAEAQLKRLELLYELEKSRGKPLAVAILP